MTQTLEHLDTDAAGAEPGSPAPEASRPGRVRRAAGRAVRALGASAGFLAALAVVAVCAAYLTFPHAPEFAFVHRVPKAATLIPALALGAAIAAIAAWRAAARLLRKTKGADAMTLIAAAVATGVSATGMWAFFAAYVPSISPGLRIPLFAFLELGVLAESLRARDNMRDFGSAGIDGIAMWGAAATGAFLASLASTSLAEALFRLVPPLGAAWLWERALVSERRRSRERQGGKSKKIAWRISPARILVKFSLAEPAGRTLGEVTSQRRITDLALASDTATRCQGLRTGSLRRRRADARLRRAMRYAIDETDLATSTELQQILFAQIGALNSTRDLVAGDTMAPWQQVADRRRRRKPDDRKPDDRKDDDRKDDRGGGGAKDPTGGSGSQLAGLAAKLAPAVRQQDAQEIHRLLSDCGDYAALARHLGATELFGAKRLMALAAIYAQPEVAATDNRNATWEAWVRSHVPGDAGKVDRAEFRRMLELISPVWHAEKYPAANDGSVPEQKAG